MACGLTLVAFCDGLRSILIFFGICSCSELSKERFRCLGNTASGGLSSDDEFSSDLPFVELFTNTFLSAGSSFTEAIKGVSFS